jgi:hypothetical protein
MHRMLACMLVASACGSEVDPCTTGSAIEVRTEDLGPVTATDYTCTGELAFCETYPDRAMVWLDCAGGVKVRIGVILPDGGWWAALFVEPADGGFAVRAQAESTCNDCPLQIEPLLDGWVAFEETSLDPQARHAGHFSMTFERGSIAGTFDTSNSQ